MRSGFQRSLLILCLIVTLVSAVPARAAEPVISVYIDGVSYPFPQAPVLIEGTTMVPMRAIFEAFGATVSWDGSTSTVTAKKGAKQIILRIGESVAQVSGQPVTLLRPAQIINGYTLVPLRFVSEALGARVSWDGATSSVRITRPPSVFKAAEGPLTHVAAVAAGGSGSLAVAESGTVWFSGRNEATGDEFPKPVRIDGIPPVQAAAAGGQHFLLLTKAGTVLSWGSNQYGQLGLGEADSQAAPAAIAGMQDVTAIAASWLHSVALRRDGTVWGWGGNGAGQLGDGTRQNRRTPVQVPGLNGIVAVSAGEGHTLALASDGTVWAWGTNMYGQLGDGTGTRSSIPVRVQGLTDVKSISAGYEHSLAVRRDGTVWAWGNYDRQHFSGQNRVLQPVRLPGLSAIVAVSAGMDHSLALRRDGRVYAWGQSLGGNLAAPGEGLTPVPVQLAEPKEAAAISAAISHSLVLGRDGKVSGWAIVGGNLAQRVGLLGVASEFQPALATADSDLTGADREHAAPLGFELTKRVDRYPAFVDALVSVKQVVRGAAAWAQLQAANRHNPAAPAGYEYLMARVSIEVSAPPYADLRFRPIAVQEDWFKAYTSDGQPYPRTFVVEPAPRLPVHLRTDFDQEKRAEAWIAFLVAQSDPAPVLHFAMDHYGNGGAWFATGEAQAGKNPVILPAEVLPTFRTTEELAAYLNQHYGHLETPFRNLSLSYEIAVNDRWDSAQDFTIRAQYDDVMFFLDLYGKRLAEADLLFTQEKLKEHSYDVYRLASHSFPDKKMDGSYYHGAYTYPYLQLDYTSTRHFTWTNYDGSLTSYSASKLGEFRFTPERDD